MTGQPEVIASPNPVSYSGLTIVEVDQNTSGPLSLTATVALLTTDIPTPYIGNPLSPSKRALDYGQTFYAIETNELPPQYYKMAFLEVLTHSYGYAPEKMRAAFLDLRRAQGAQDKEPLDPNAVESFRHSDRSLFTIEKMHHSDFTSFAMVGAQFHAPLPTNYPLNGWNRETGRAGYQEGCKIT